MVQSPLRLRRGMGADIEHPFSATLNGKAYPSFPIGAVLASNPEILRARVPPTIGQFLIVPGSRFYVDHGNFLEDATALCDNAEDVVAHVHAGYRRFSRWLQLHLDRLARYAPQQRYEVNLYCNNLGNFDQGQQVSCGSHENYQILTGGSIQSFARPLVGYFVSGILLYGSGRLREDFEFEISQRAGFFTETFGMETTRNRAIINTRDEPHATGTKRLHVIVRDNSISYQLDILKRNDLHLLLIMREEDRLEGIMPDDPSGALRAISRQPGVSVPVGSRSMTALEMAWHYYDQQMCYLTEPRNRDVRELMLPWIQLKGQHLRRLAKSLDPHDHKYQLDWATRHVILEAYQQRGITGESLRVRDTQLQKINGGAGSGWQSLLRRFGGVDEERIARALEGPPTTTRSWALAELIKKYGSTIQNVDWEYVLTPSGYYKLADPLDPSIPEPGPIPATIRLGLR